MLLELSDDSRFLIIQECTKLELDQLRISLTKRIKNWRFHPLVKKGHWDGYFSYLLRDKYIPSGLWKEVVEICKEFDLQVQFKGIRRLFDNELTMEEFQAWVDDFFKDHSMDPRPYQIDAAFKILKTRKCIAELATSAGKTLISFMVVSYMLQKQLAKRILFIVPKVDLVIQATDDFDEYNESNTIDLKIQQIYSGKKIKPSANIVIGTYQSLVKKTESYFEQFDAILVDECLHPDTLIMMSDGTEKKISEIKIGDFVKTTNDKTLELQDMEVDYVYENLSTGNQMYELEMEDGSNIKITGNHKVKLISGEYKRVDELNTDDEILSVYDIVYTKNTKQSESI